MNKPSAKERKAQSTRDKLRHQKQMRSLGAPDVKTRSTPPPPVSRQKVTSSTSKSSTVINGSERIRDIIDVAAENFLFLGSTTVNPGLPSSFPWLSPIAKAYDQYRFKKLKFTYHPSVGTSSNGNVIMAYDKDSDQTEPLSAVGASQRTKYVNTPVWKEASIDVPCDGKVRFTRTGILVPSGEDVKLLDLGQMCFCSTNLDGIGGYITVSYSIELLNRTSLENEIPYFTNSQIHIESDGVDSTQGTPLSMPIVRGPPNSFNVAADQKSINIDVGLYRVTWSGRTVNTNDINTIHLRINGVNFLRADGQWQPTRTLLYRHVANTDSISFVCNSSAAGPVNLLDWDAVFTKIA